MSITDPGERSAADIEREVEATRARLTGTVEELKERVAPGQVAEQAMDWLRGSGGREFLGNLGTTIRDNPMPVLLVAAGIGWLALSGGRDRAASRAWSRDDRAAPPVEGGQGYAGAYPGEIYGESYAGESYPPETYARRTGDAGGPSVTARAGEAATGLRDRAGAVAERAGEAASELRDRAAAA
uniref:DUF3618 domain-containing protein n=1 Tax=Falsiroseomonas oryzae TaxID=2766473 RepID=UPI0022EAD41E